MQSPCNTSAFCKRLASPTRIRLQAGRLSEGTNKPARLSDSCVPLRLPLPGWIHDAERMCRVLVHMTRTLNDLAGTPSSSHIARHRNLDRFQSTAASFFSIRSRCASRLGSLVDHGRAACPCCPREVEQCGGRPSFPAPPALRRVTHRCCCFCLLLRFSVA